MSKKLTKKQIELLESLYDNQELNGRGHLRMFLIRNTYEPKYKIGDFVKISDDTATYIWGNRIVDVKAKVVDIDWWLGEKGKEHVQYECIAYDQFGKDHTLFAEESIHGNYQSRHITGRCKTDKNTFKIKSKVSDCINM